MKTPLDRAMKECAEKAVEEALRHLEMMSGEPRTGAAASDRQFFMLPGGTQGRPPRRASVHFEGRTKKISVEFVTPMVNKREYNLSFDRETETLRNDIKKLRNDIKKLRKAPAELAEEVKELFAYLLSAGVTREEVIELLDTAVVESVLES
jgi:hypothetical protein